MLPSISGTHFSLRRSRNTHIPTPMGGAAHACVDFVLGSPFPRRPLPSEKGTHNGQTVLIKVCVGGPAVCGVSVGARRQLPSHTYGKGWKRIKRQSQRGFGCDSDPQRSTQAPS